MSHSGNLANALRLWGKLPQALAAYRRAVELSPQSAEAHYNLGVALGETAACTQAMDAYRQLLTDREMARLRVRDLQRAEADARRQIGMYQARVEQTPMVEQQLASVQRDYDLEKAQYSDLSGRFHAATIAENVARNRRGEQFTVLYAASHPTDPVRPIPLRVMLISIATGIFLGAALTLLREYLDRSVHDARDIKDEFDLPVLGEVGRIKAA